MRDNMKENYLENNKVILKNNEKNNKKKWYQIQFNKKIDEIYLYNYKSLNLRTSLLTLLFVCFFPFIFDLCNKFIFNNQNQLASGLFILFKFLIIVSIGSYCWFIEKSNFYKKGLIFYYLFQVFITYYNFSYYFYYLFNYRLYFLVLFNFILFSVIIILVFWKSVLMRQKTFNTFHYHWWVILITTIVIFALEYLIKFTFLNWIYNSGSMNETFLTQIAKESNLATIIVAVYAALMAPIIEELAYRYALPMICRNRWIGLIFGSFFFGWFHVGGYGDFKNVFYYWIAGLIWNTLFIIMREKFVYGSISHAFFNFTAYFI